MLAKVVQIGLHTGLTFPQVHILCVYLSEEWAWIEEEKHAVQKWRGPLLDHAAVAR